MSFKCLTCGFKGKKAKQGACPACGSFNIKQKRVMKLEPEENKKKLTIKSIAMTALWLYFGYMLFQRFIVG